MIHLFILFCLSRGMWQGIRSFVGPTSVQGEDAKFVTQMKGASVVIGLITSGLSELSRAIYIIVPRWYAKHKVPT
jgi:hypothetical protein